MKLTYSLTLSAALLCLAEISSAATDSDAEINFQLDPELEHYVMNGEVKKETTSPKLDQCTWPGADYKNCLDHEQWSWGYFYLPVTKRCEETDFCANNTINNFQSIDACTKACVAKTEPDQCSWPQFRYCSDQEQMVVGYFYFYPLRKCVKSYTCDNNTYNSFQTKQDCNKACLAKDNETSSKTAGNPQKSSTIFYRLAMAVSLAKSSKKPNSETTDDSNETPSLDSEMTTALAHDRCRFPDPISYNCKRTVFGIFYLAYYNKCEWYQACEGHNINNFTSDDACDNACVDKTRPAKPETETDQCSEPSYEIQSNCNLVDGFFYYPHNKKCVRDQDCEGHNINNFTSIDDCKKACAKWGIVDTVH